MAKAKLIRSIRPILDEIDKIIPYYVDANHWLWGLEQARLEGNHLIARGPVLTHPTMDGDLMDFYEHLTIGIRGLRPERVPLQHVLPLITKFQIFVRELEREEPFGVEK